MFLNKIKNKININYKRNKVLKIYHMLNFKNIYNKLKLFKNLN